MKFLDKKTIFSEILYQANSNNFLHIFNLCSEIREKWPEQTKTIDFCISNYLIKKIQDHSRSMLNEIDKSFSLKKTINTIMIN